MLPRLCVALLVIGCAMPLIAAEPAGPVYELRIYTCEPGKLGALEERFREHTMRLFEKHGIKNLAYWKPAEGPTAETTLIYLLEYPSRDAAKASWEAFRADPEWKQVAADSEAKYGKILAKPPESIYLNLTDYSPAVGLPHPGKIYELRTYTAPPGKLNALHKRFREHTDKLFQKHGLRAYGYWTPADAPRSADTLIYVLESPNRETADHSWDAFRADLEWKAAFAASEKDGALTASRPTSVYMNLVDYSPTAAE
ncbi:NIPSNAP family protein [Planctomicrobium sp. SH661]|uniref:NIPSNAP family protein n=1 Tax=Planctomicrobium sp. SH661 TaxID=3448124 RepID=UPI003F5C64CE